MTTTVAALQAERAGAAEVVPYVPLWGVIALTAVALAVTGLALLLGRPQQDGGRAELRVLSWKWVLIGIMLIVVCMWGSAAVLLALADTAPDAAKRVELRLDAVKTGLSVGAGAAGLVALLLGVRRQWLGERAQAHQEYDATEKRVTELYTKAADQLGHDKAAVRLAGLYALERVAQHNPEHRQTIVDVICAYLRMPPPLTDRSPAQGSDADGGPQGRGGPGDRERELRALVDPQELQVRIAAQRILRDHLRWSRSEQTPPATFWPGIDLDLTGAWLVKLDLTDCRIRKTGFGSATFEGFARFDRATFGDRTTFAGAFFLGTADWETANYKAGFQEALFEAETMFRETVFAQRADFRGVTFLATALFDHAVFRQLALFRRTRFTAEALFSGATFAGEAVFREARSVGVLSQQPGRLSGVLTDEVVSGPAVLVDDPPARSSPGRTAPACAGAARHCPSPPAGVRRAPAQLAARLPDRAERDGGRRRVVGGAQAERGQALHHRRGRGCRRRRRGW
ncbi:pentapeptide repeat-containing protein [Nonomuraea wenchangensis]|uniref:pentapeptide repeat-containing protein n=1 Tax=Nonomuraea wenchangensis TaxID=568860 RepID=UPI0033225A1D